MVKKIVIVAIVAVLAILIFWYSQKSSSVPNSNTAVVPSADEAQLDNLQPADLSAEVQQLDSNIDQLSATTTPAK